MPGHLFNKSGRERSVEWIAVKIEGVQCRIEKAVHAGELAFIFIIQEGSDPSDQNRGVILPGKVCQ
jgi:hypothetical protein